MKGTVKLCGKTTKYFMVEDNENRLYELETVRDYEDGEEIRFELTDFKTAKEIEQ